jgi:PPOX class probable F420-dependent enzyme
MNDPRLLTEKNIWLATVRPDGRPHLVPIWFIWLNEKVYICTEGKSVKIKNIQANPRVSVALENGSQPAIGEGTAVILQPPYAGDIIAEFKHKYDWDITQDASYNVLVEITPAKWLKW